MNAKGRPWHGVEPPPTHSTAKLQGVALLCVIAGCLLGFYLPRFIP